jgi:hypothetical protein
VGPPPATSNGELPSAPDGLPRRCNNLGLPSFSFSTVPRRRLSRMMKHISKPSRTIPPMTEPAIIPALFEFLAAGCAGWVELRNGEDGEGSTTVVSVGVVAIRKK